jgi:hypothetical protein
MARGNIETYFQGGLWKNRIEGLDRASTVHQTETQARAVGRRMAKARGVRQVIIGADGQVVEATAHAEKPGPSRWRRRWGRTAAEDGQDGRPVQAER